MIDQVVLYPLGDDPPQARLMYGRDCLASLRALPDQSVHMVATSPPYFGLRCYSPGMVRLRPDITSDDRDRVMRELRELGVDPIEADPYGPMSIYLKDSIPDHLQPFFCPAELGLEDTPEQYVERLVAVFREIRRVLRDEGTVWLNLGDSYATPMKGIGGDHGFSAGGDKRQNNRTQPKMAQPTHANYGSLPVKSKDILGIPWRVAFALQADGWYLRQDIVWAKNNPMPSSVTDRCTTAHEYVFLLAKAERYFFDQDAIKERAVGQTAHDLTGGFYAAPGLPPHTGTRKALHGPTYSRHRSSVPGGQDLRKEPSAYRNRRSVWNINPKPYPGAHFATWPEELVSLMIQAGSSAKGCCSKCGAPQSRITKKKSRGHDGSKYGAAAVAATGGAISGRTAKSTLGSNHGAGTNETVTVGWQATCTCEAELGLCTVLDPFSGSATTGAVSLRLGRHYVGLDLNEDYFPLAHARLEGRRPPGPATETDELQAFLDSFSE